jgi:hypothetical protein
MTDTPQEHRFAEVPIPDFQSPTLTMKGCTILRCVIHMPDDQHCHPEGETCHVCADAIYDDPGPF